MMKKIMAVMCTMVFALLCACSSNDGESVPPAATIPPTATATPSPAVTPEPTKTLAQRVEYEYDSFTFQEGQHTKTYFASTRTWSSDRAVYQLEASLSDEEKLACIESTEAILALLNLDEMLTIHVMKDGKYTSVYVEEGKLYVCPQDWDSVEYVSWLVLAGYGQWCNYGLAYGYANQICAELGWEHSAPKSFSKLFLIGYFDMDLPCFSTQYVSEDKVAEVKELACFFVDGYIKANGKEEFLTLLSESGDVEKIAEAGRKMTEFYASQGISYTPTEVLFAPGGEYYEFIVRNPYAFLYLPKEWQDYMAGETGILPANFLHEDYLEMKQLFKTKTEQMGQYQELFGLDTYDNTAAFCFVNKVPYAQGKRSTYFWEEHTAYVSSVTHMMHEYIHALTINDSNRRHYWALEGFAQYFEQRYAYYANIDYNLWLSYISTNEIEESDWLVRCVQAYSRNTGRAFSVPEDWTEYMHILTYLNGYVSPDDDEGYIPGASFLGYLTLQYGEEAVIRYCCVETEEKNSLGKTYEELVEAWQEFIRTEYAWCEEYR